MTREEELDWLCRLRSEIYVYMPKEWLIPMNNALDMAISALSESKGEWIPVSERLPRIADVYRVTRYYPNNVMNPIYLVDACCFDGFNTWYDDNRINHERAYADNVIAWQENPEPYKPEKPETCKGCLEPCIMYEPDMRACKKKVTERGE